METLYKVAELEVSYKTKVKAKDRIRIKTSQDSNDLFLQMHGNEIEYRESFYLMCLNRRNEVLAYYKLSVGGIKGTIVDPVILFQIAITCHSSAIIINHNHPSGNTCPSQEDLKLTARIKEISKLLGIKLLDHVITTEDSYFSFADEGIL